MEDVQALVLAGIVVVITIYIVRWRMNPLNSIPTLGGSSLPGLSYLTAQHFMRNAKDIIDEGYDRFYNGTYKVAMPDKWLVITSGPKMINELRRRPDEELSFIAGVEDILQVEYTIGKKTMQDSYHVEIIRENLTRALPIVLPDVVDEIRLATQESIPAKDDDKWVAVTVMPTMQRIVARASNRAFVGLPLCRNEGFLNVALDFTNAFVKDRNLLNRCPSFLKPLVGLYNSQTKTSVRSAMQYLKPLVDERKMQWEQNGDDWEGKPNDMLQWIFDVAIRKENVDCNMAKQVLLVNFAAIDTASISITHAIFDLAARPELLKPLRDEVESIVTTEGWTKTAMDKMWKLDSFLRECLRWNGISLIGLTRKAMRDLTLNDGTCIPKGTLVTTAQRPTHRDHMNYPDPNVFDGFRFARMREQEGGSTKHQFVSTSIGYVAFGHGRHACPGRFFVASELKAMLAYIVLNYDLKLAGNGERPQNVYMGLHILPPMCGQVLFRKREASQNA